MNSHAIANNKIIKFFLIVLSFVLVFSLALNVVLLNNNNCFTALLFDNYKISKYKDPVTISYNGNEYALINASSSYRVKDCEMIELTNLYYASYLDSILSNCVVYGIKDDVNRIFLYCDYQYCIDSYDEYAGGRFGGYYYRTDFVFPSPVSADVCQIDLYFLSDFVCSITDREMIKYFLGEQTDVKTKNIVSHLEKEIIEDINMSELYAYAVFSDSCLEYRLGYLGNIDDNKPFKSYGEKNFQNESDSWWSYYNIEYGFENTGNSKVYSVEE